MINGMASSDVGIRLRAHRQALGLSLAEAAERAGLPKLRLDLIERGAPPPPDTLNGLVAGLAIDRDLAVALDELSGTWRRPQPEDWGSGVCTVVTRNRDTGADRRKEWYYFVLDRRVGPCFLEPAGKAAQWIRDLVADPRVRLIVNDGVYIGVARLTHEPTELDAVKELFREKYGNTGDSAVADLLDSNLAVIATDDPRIVHATSTASPM